MAKKRKKNTLVLTEWVDRDLMADPKALKPAFGVDDVLSQVQEVLHQESRTPVLTGERGVGKTAVIHELLRRAADGDGPLILRDRPVLQLGLRATAGRFAKREEAAEAFHKVLAHVRSLDPEPILYIRDLHAAFALDWEALILRHLTQSTVPMLGEAQPPGLHDMLEYSSDLAEYIVPIPMAEPRRDAMVTILDAWSERIKSETSVDVLPRARRALLDLTGRFLGNQRFPRKAIDLLGHTLTLRPDDSPPVIDARAVVARFSQRTRVPARLVDPDTPLDLGEVHDFLASRLLGQEEAVEAAVRMIALIKAGLADYRRPFAVFLFVGPTGVGKTHTAQLLAEYLFGRGDRLVRINMSEFQGEEGIKTLFGDPDHPRMPQRRGLLTKRLAGVPFGVLLLDEFEKAHTKVHDAFLQLMDEGRFINGASETVSATSMIIIATSNCGAEVYRSVGLGFGQPRDIASLDQELDRKLMTQFRFEFLNRFDRVVHFHPLDRGHIRAIAERELQELMTRDGFDARSLRMEIDVEVLDWLVAHGYHPHFGARFLRREIERHVTGAVAEAIVRSRAADGATLHLMVRRGRIEVDVVGPSEERAEVPVPHGAATATRVMTLDEALSEGRAAAERWAVPLQQHEARRTQADALMARSLEPGFWDQADEAQEILRRFKALDARLQTDARLLSPVLALAEQLRQPDASLGAVSSLLRRAHSAWERWSELEGTVGGDAAWVVLSPADGLHAPTDWLDDLVGMYEGWFRKLGWTWDVVAERPVEDGVDWVVFEVEGPGAVDQLAVERGEHQRRRAGRRERVRVEVLPRDDLEGVPDGASVQDARHGRGRHLARRRARLELQLPKTGVTVRLVGSDGEALRLLAHALSAPVAASQLARTYGLKGGAVQDPRTRASHPNIKDVLRGDLEPFATGWRTRSG